MQRYFAKVINNEVILDEQDVFHLTKVMRAKPNDRIEVVSDKQLYIAEVKTFKPLYIEVVNKVNEDHELKNDVVLICSLIKGDKMDLVLQKATELGVSEIVLLSSDRSIVKIRKEDEESKLERFRKILKEASEQSKRTVVPALNKIIKMNELNRVNASIKLIAYEEVAGNTKELDNILSKVNSEDRIAIIVGPEGGFTKEEVALANDSGYKCISLGKRILRAETASIYAISVIGNYLDR